MIKTLIYKNVTIQGNTISLPVTWEDQYNFLIPLLLKKQGIKVAT